MPQTISVNPAHADKLMINGVDLLNREELSESQNRELQRYIDAHSHLLGFADKEKEEKDAEGGGVGTGSFTQHRSYNSYSLDYARPTATGAGGGSGLAGEDFGRSTQSLGGRVHSPATSDYGGKRKGVSWSDGVNSYVPPRARSHSPTTPAKREVIQEQRTTEHFVSSQNMGSNSYPAQNGTNGYTPQPQYTQPRMYSPAYSTSDKRRTPYTDYEYSRGGDSPWGDTWSRASRDSLHGGRDSAASGWKGFPKNDISVYSTLERNPDDFKPWQSHKYREEQLRRSQDRDDTIKFYGYGDHKVSGIELKPKKWTGGEIITDPTYITKSLKPRRMFYSPIGDGVVEADGIEMKKGPPDLNPRVSVIHERYVERDPGNPGRRVTEHYWDEGNRGPKEAEGDGLRQAMPPADNGLGDGLARPKPAEKRGPPYDDGGPRRPPYDDGGPRRPPYTGDLDSGPRPASALSAGPEAKVPREGWTKTFIVNPRELIHQYSNETPTNIFNLDDHTPRTIVTTKETISEVTRE